MKLTDIYCVSCITSIVLSAVHVQIQLILSNTPWDLYSSDINQLFLKWSNTEQCIVYRGKRWKLMFIYVHLICLKCHFFLFLWLLYDKHISTVLSKYAHLYWKGCLRWNFWRVPSKSIAMKKHKTYAKKESDSYRGSS